MAKTITPITKATDTFDTWITQTNVVIDTISVEVLTANNNVNGAYVTGNSQLFGDFTANVVAVYDELRGGNIQSSAALSVTSDMVFTDETTYLRLGDAAVNCVANNQEITLQNSTVTYTMNKPSAAQVSSGDYYLASDSTWNQIDITAFALIGSNPANDRLAIWSSTDTIEGTSTLTYNGTVLTVGGSAGINVTAGDIKMTDETNYLRIGDSSANIVVNNEVIVMQNSTASWTIIKPTASQISAGEYYLAADGDWKASGANGGPGDVLKTGSPLNNYIAHWTDDTTITGTSAFQWNETTLTVGGNANVTGGELRLGQDDSVNGMLLIYGGGTGEDGGIIRIYNNADDDTTVGYWEMTAEDGTGDFVISEDSVTDALRINDTTKAVTIANGATVSGSGGLKVTGGLLTVNGGSQSALNIGVNDSIPGLLTVYGGGSSETGAILRLYNASDHDTTVDYWQIHAADGSGNFVIENNSGTDALSIDDATLAATFLDDVTADDFIAVDLPTPTNYTAADDRLTTHLDGIDTALGSAGGGATLNANNTHDATYYPGLSSSSSGAWSNAVVATTKLYFNPADGELSATDFNTLSDATLKEDINPIEGALDKIHEINGVQFKWRENKKKSAGVLAQEVQKILPELVNENNTVKFIGVIGLLVEAVKEVDDKYKKVQDEIDSKLDTILKKLNG